MYTEFDNRAALVKIIEKLDDFDTKLVLAFAVGYEAGKASSKTNLSNSDLSRLCEPEGNIE